MNRNERAKDGGCSPSFFLVFQVPAQNKPAGGFRAEKQVYFLRYSGVFFNLVEKHRQKIFDSRLRIGDCLGKKDRKIWRDAAMGSKRMLRVSLTGIMIFYMLLGLSPVHIAPAEAANPERAVDISTPTLKALTAAKVHYQETYKQRKKLSEGGELSPEEIAALKTAAWDMMNPSKIAMETHSNPWIITSAVLYGVGGIDAAANTLRSNDAIEMILSSKQAAQQMVKDLLQKTSSQQKPGQPPASMPTSANHDVNVYLASIDNLQQLSGVRGIDPNFPIFDMSRQIAIVLLIAFTFLRLTYMLYEMIIKGENKTSLQFFLLFKKTFIIMIILLYLDSIIWSCLEVSYGITRMISGTPDGQAVDFGEAVSLFMEQKIALLNIDSGGVWDVIINGVSNFFKHMLGLLCFWLAQAVIKILLIVSDVMMAITAMIGPFILVMSMIPTFESFIGHWMKGVITLMFWHPLAAVYSILAAVLMAIGVDTSFVAFLVISIAYLMGASKIPNIAEGMSGAVLAGIAGMAAMAPAKLAMGAAGGMAGSAGGAVGGAIMNKLKKMGG